jgi:Cu/Ag efflux pump CusA
VMMGGLLSSTLLNLVLVPAGYAMLYAGSLRASHPTP